MRSPIWRFVSPSAISSRILRSWSVRTGQLVLVALVSDPVEHPGGDERVEQRAPGGDLADAVDQVGAADLLEHVAGRPGHDRGVDGLVLGERGQHDAGDLRVPGADLAADLDPVAVGQPDVEDGHVGRGGRDPPVGLLGRSGLADDLEVVLRLEQLAQPAADDLVIVEQEHAGGHRFSLPLRKGRSSTERP